MLPIELCVRIRRCVLFAFGATLALGAAQSATAAVYVTGSVRDGTQTMGYTSTDSKAGSLSVQMDLGQYVRIGITNEQSVETEAGYQSPANATGTDDAGNKVQLRVYSNIRSVADSIDLTLILYQGEVFVPYILGGIIKKDYTITKLVDNEMLTGPVSLPPGPNVGLGVGIRVHRDFTLKFQYTVSPGIIVKPVDDKAEGVLDRSTSVGLSYQI